MCSCGIWVSRSQSPAEAILFFVIGFARSRSVLYRWTKTNPPGGPGSPSRQGTTAVDAVPPRFTPTFHGGLFESRVVSYERHGRGGNMAEVKKELEVSP